MGGYSYTHNVLYDPNDTSLASESFPGLYNTPEPPRENRKERRRKEALLRRNKHGA